MKKGYYILILFGVIWLSIAIKFGFVISSLFLFSNLFLAFVKVFLFFGSTMTYSLLGSFTDRGLNWLFNDFIKNKFSIHETFLKLWEYFIRFISYSFFLIVFLEIYKELSDTSNWEEAFYDLFNKLIYNWYPITK